MRINAPLMKKDATVTFTLRAVAIALAPSAPTRLSAPDETPARNRNTWTGACAQAVAVSCANNAFPPDPFRKPNAKVETNLKKRKALRGRQTKKTHNFSFHPQGTIEFRHLDAKTHKITLETSNTPTVWFTPRASASALAPSSPIWLPAPDETPARNPGTWMRIMRANRCVPPRQNPDVVSSNPLSRPHPINENPHAYSC